MELPTETPFLVTTKFEKYGTYHIMARSKEHAIKKFEDGDGILMITKRSGESITK
tara:strand:+ start:249 stop:413 length:165 start_codon:yes stop_codon:yes gene_type:complete